MPMFAGKRVTAHDAREIVAFKRFLAEVGMMSLRGILRDHPGWVPYTLGHFFGGGEECSLHPPLGFGSVPVTAWTFPG